MHITMYDSVDDMFDDLDKAMQAADANVKDWQKAIKKGDCFWQDTGYGFQVYGEVLKDAYKEVAPFNR